MLGAKPVTVMRPQPGIWHDGSWLESQPATVVIRASVQPAKERDLERLPEGQRTKGAIRVFSKDAIYTADEGAGRRADRITHAGRHWEVATVDHWDHGSLAHYDAICTLVEPEAVEP